MAFEKDIARRYRDQRAYKLATTRASIMEALARGDDVTALRATLAELEALPDVPAGDDAAMVAAWPAGFEPLPQYITDPAGARAAEDQFLANLGLVRGGPIVINVGRTANDDVVVGDLDPASEAAIIARRLDRKPRDDAAMAAFQEAAARRREPETEAGMLERRLGIPITRIRKILGIGS